MLGAEDAPVLDIFYASEYKALSNFAEGFGFWTEGAAPSSRVWWPTAEHFFQAGKFVDPQLQAQVRAAPSAGEAKYLGRTLSPLRSDWDDVKEERMHRAMLEKFWAHESCREKLLAIPAETRIINGNPADPFFGTGTGRDGLNVIGTVLEELRLFFRANTIRLMFAVSVMDGGAQFAPFRARTDLTGIEPSAALPLAAQALGVSSSVVLDVELVTDAGFERCSVTAFEDVDAFQKFLRQHTHDCSVELCLQDAAVVTVWDGFTDNYVGRAEVQHVHPTVSALYRRLQVMVPIFAHSAFARNVTVNVDGDDLGALDDRIFAQMRCAAVDGADVVVTINYEMPVQGLEPVLYDRSHLGTPGVITIEHGHAAHTAFDKLEMRDRVRGLFWGAALGDAVGLSTEFMKLDEAAAAYPAGAMQLGPASRVEDRHRSRWTQGDWTDDTDQLVLLADAVVAGSGVIDPAAFASSLKQWQHQGFPELGDTSGLGIGETVHGVLEHVAFDVAPAVAAEVIWREGGCAAAANGAVMRSAGAAIGYFWEEEVVAHNAAEGARTTHFDPRCVASCVAVAYLVSRTLQGVSLDDVDRREGEVGIAYHRAVSFLQGQDSDELWKVMTVGPDSLRCLQLGTGGIGYTYKPVGAACWAFVHATDFKDAITAITMEAGDADSNATVAGALLGARLGYNALPQDWLEAVPQPQAAWMNSKLDSYFTMLGL